MHPRREKHAIISTNGQQNMTIIGIKLEEVFSFKTKKILKVSDGGTPSDGGTLMLYNMEEENTGEEQHKD